MTEIVLAKAANGVLLPADQQSAECIAKMKLGAGVKLKATKVTPNNLRFHRKLFALLDIAYDAWEPTEPTYLGKIVAKNKEQFREDITILAGFFKTNIRLNGEIRLTAKSWAFESMDDIEKDKLYNSIINVVLSRILTKYTRADLDAVVESVLRFA